MTVVTYYTESGDSGVLGVFTRLPTKEEIDSIAIEKYPEEYDEYQSIFFRAYEVEAVQEL